MNNTPKCISEPAQLFVIGGVVTIIAAHSISFVATLGGFMIACVSAAAVIDKACENLKSEDKK